MSRSQDTAGQVIILSVCLILFSLALLPPYDGTVPLADGTLRRREGGHYVVTDAIWFQAVIAHAALLVGTVTLPISFVWYCVPNLILRSDGQQADQSKLREARRRSASFPRLLVFAFFVFLIRVIYKIYFGVK